MAAAQKEYKIVHADYTTASNEELRRRAAKGDQAAFAELNRRRAATDATEAA